MKVVIKEATDQVTLDKLYNSEAYCAEGLDNDDESIHKLANAIQDKWIGAKETDEIYFYRCMGKDLNEIYHLTGSNRYKDDLNILFLDWNASFSKSFDVSRYKGNFRYFSDVVDNNARREIRKGNEHYKDYHSLYGDSWFYGTI